MSGENEFSFFANIDDVAPMVAAEMGMDEAEARKLVAVVLKCCHLVTGVHARQTVARLARTTDEAMSSISSGQNKEFNLSMQDHLRILVSQIRDDIADLASIVN